MPAYGPQVVPQVPDVPAPLIPKADTSVAENITRSGAAGLAAFTNMAAMAQRAVLEREQLAQQGALKLQEFGIQREQNAMHYRIEQQRLKQQKAISDNEIAARNKPEEYLMKQYNDMAAYFASPDAPAFGTPEFAKYALKAGIMFPAAIGRTEAGHKLWQDISGLHDGVVDTQQRFQQMLNLYEGLHPGQTPDVKMKLDEKGNIIPEISPPDVPKPPDQPKPLNEGQMTEIDKERYQAAIRERQKHEELASKERADNIKRGQKGGFFAPKTKDIPYSGTKDWMAANETISKIEKKYSEQTAPRGGAFKSPGAYGGPTTQIIPAPANPADRKKDEVYDTPRGPKRWTGTGWIDP